MSRNDDQFLGENVTEMAAAGRKQGSAVISVRLSTAEIVHLEDLGRLSGRTASQVIRDAIAAYEVNSSAWVVSVGANGLVFTVGGEVRTQGFGLVNDWAHQELIYDAPSGTLVG